MDFHGTWRTIALLTGVALVSAACDTLFPDAQDPPLPGERLSVMVHSRTLAADPELADAEILLPPPSINPDWPQAGGYANHAMHHIEVGDSLNEAWSEDVGESADDEERLVASPIAAGGMVFTIDADTAVSALGGESGNKLWSVELTPDEEDDGHISGGLAFENGQVFVSTGFAQVIALNAKTGEVNWRRSVEAPMRAAPTVRGGRVFVITLDNKLYALNAQTGETLWTYSAATEVASLLGGASPAVDEGIVVAPFTSGELIALRVESGRVLWTESLAAVRRTDVVSTLSHIRGRPIIDRGRVYAVSHSGQMAAIDLRSGRRVWDKEIGGLENPWVAGDYLFLLTNDAELLCLSRKSGRVFWVQSLPRFEDEEDREDPIVWTGPILASDRLIVAGSHGESYAISPYDGRFLGKMDMPDGVSVPPIVAGGIVYVLTDNASLVALR
ncbi:MAG: PQQ-binding-like beta-propeller repeat protein [Rhodospirillales bacterium]|jgi:outer membrane protein assembly factor BamB|nr:PQQ-binding-like beta-propeller repeat protein [Rhodospirillales bacterium]